MTPSRLHIVAAPPAPVEPDEALVRLVPQLLAREAEVARLRNEVDQHRRALARKRKVAFIRPEAVRMEFAG